jgi:hypothetical protein
VGDQADRLLVPEPGHIAAIEELEEGCPGQKAQRGRRPGRCSGSLPASAT